MEDIRVKLSVLWLFATLNYIYADVIFCLNVLGSNKGGPSAPHFSPGAWLGVAIVLEIPIAMVLMSRLLKPRANRWANILAGIIETAAVLLTTFIFPIVNLTTTTLYYLFFGVIEVACTSLIVWYAWKWPRETAQPN
jgi:MFS family permease